MKTPTTDTADPDYCPHGVSMHDWESDCAQCDVDARIRRTARRTATYRAKNATYRKEVGK